MTENQHTPDQRGLKLIPAGCMAMVLGLLVFPQGGYSAIISGCDPVSSLLSNSQSIPGNWNLRYFD